MSAPGLTDKSERDHKLEVISDELERLDAKSRLVLVPEDDWSWPAKAVNGVLRTILEVIELDEQMTPVRARWRVPEWRADS